MDSAAEVALAADLVRAPSVSGHESPAVEVMLGAMRSLGYDEVSKDEAGNAVGVFRRGEGPSVMFNGHLDTVPYGDESLWPHPPLSGAVVDGRLWGRGACDMKGAIACMVLAAADTAAAGFSGTLVVTGVVQEEVGGLGAGHLGKTHRCDVVILGEPTKLNLKLGHRGYVGINVEFRGKIAHAARAELGRNALRQAAAYVAAMDGLELPHGGPLVGSSATPTKLLTQPQEASNVVPGYARLTVDYRSMPGDEAEAVVARFRRLAGDANTEVSIPEVEIVSENGAVSLRRRMVASPYLAPLDSPQVATAREVIGRVVAQHGLAYQEGYWWFCTDAPHLAQTGGVVIGFGPGEEELAHTTNESVSIAELGVARHGYRELAQAYLGRGA